MFNEFKLNDKVTLRNKLVIFGYKAINKKTGWN